MDPLQLTEKLVEFQTVEKNPGEIEDCLEFLEQQFGERFVLRRFEKEGDHSLLISFEETVEPKILLHGHIDVVEAEEEMFEPAIEGNKLKGRGTADMKAGVASLVVLMKKFAEEQPDIALLLTSDEERGGFNGTGYLVGKEGLEPEFVISAEPDDSGSFPSIVTEQKGVLQLEISVEGEGAHASKPGEGKNAIEKLMEKYSRIEELFEDGDFPTTLNLGEITGGEAVNKVPEKAVMKLDIRYSGQYPKNQVLEDIEKIEGIELDVLAEAPMMQTPDQDYYVEQLIDTAEKLTGSCETRRENFASDVRFFTRKGIPAVCFGPEGYGLHGESEHVISSSLETYIRILERFITSVEE